MKTRPDGVVSAALIQRVLNLPKTDGKYKSVFTSDPSIARWRRDADGRWRLIFFTAHEGWAPGRDQEGRGGRNGRYCRCTRTQFPGSGCHPAPSARRVGSEPKEYTAFWGRFSP